MYGGGGGGSCGIKCNGGGGAGMTGGGCSWKVVDGPLGSCSTSTSSSSSSRGSATLCTLCDSASMCSSPPVTLPLHDTLPVPLSLPFDLPALASNGFPCASTSVAHSEPCDDCVQKIKINNNNFSHKIVFL